MSLALKSNTELEAERKREQEAAGDMFLFRIARLPDKRLAAVFAAADGARSYGVGDLQDDEKFKYMPHTAKFQAGFAKFSVIGLMDDIIAGKFNPEKLESEADLRTQAAEAYKKPRKNVVLLSIPAR